MLAFVPSRRYKSYTLGLWDYVQHIKNSVGGGSQRLLNSDPHVWTNHFYSSVKVTSALYGSAPHIKKKQKSRIVFFPYVVYILRRIRVPRPDKKGWKYLALCLRPPARKKERKSFSSLMLSCTLHVCKNKTTSCGREGGGINTWPGVLCQSPLWHHMGLIFRQS